MAKEKPIKEAKRGSYQIQVWPNRVVIKKKKLFGWDENNIPMSQIVNVTVNKMTQRITIETGQKEWTIPVGIGATGIKDAILENM